MLSPSDSVGKAMDYRQLKQCSLPELTTFLVEWAIANGIELPDVETINFPRLFTATHLQLVRHGETPFIKVWTTQETYKSPVVKHSEVMSYSKSKFALSLDHLEIIEFWLLNEYLKALPVPETVTLKTQQFQVNYQQVEAF